MSLLPRGRRSGERQSTNSVAVRGVPPSGSVMMPFVYDTIPCAWIPHLRARTHLGECFDEHNGQRVGARDRAGLQRLHDRLGVVRRDVVVRLDAIPAATHTPQHTASRGKQAKGRQGRGSEGRAGEDAHPGIGDGSKVHGVVWELGGLVSVRVDGHLRADMQRVAALDPLRPRVLPRPYTHRVSALLLPNLPRGARGVRTCQGAQASSGIPCVAT